MPNKALFALAPLLVALVLSLVSGLGGVVVTRLAAGGVPPPVATATR